ncbi:MAG: hypothetical protein R3A12_03995 [Ignavibacteria bacterium]
MSDLALLGGTPVRTKIFPQSNTIGEEEKIAVMKVLDSGNLSQYVGSWNKDFKGGPMVQQFENDWAEAFGVNTVMQLTQILRVCMHASELVISDREMRL